MPAMGLQHDRAVLVGGRGNIARNLKVREACEFTRLALNGKGVDRRGSDGCGPVLRSHPPLGVDVGFLGLKAGRGRFRVKDVKDLDDGVSPFVRHVGSGEGDDVIPA